ncbi:hypothetical protein PISL3812_08830 [Talaromyces islandicus]|uniref:Uncharacterized protein n=1 Tax=Talaromyces islandicus TaxID=28573 RepID=A0A0U1M8C5_TALIS|nr:hypothetical protein PISL3812_08830 [Talaromyces islandicus]
MSQYEKANVGYWPGKIDTYVDHYIAGVWNTYRAARLGLLNLILDLSGETEDTKPRDMEFAHVQELVADMLASIPYHLTEDLHAFSGNTKTQSEITNPGKAIHGLLLMHAVYITSNLPIVDPHARAYFKDCLLWIGEHMGIGQASFLATATGVDTEIEDPSLTGILRDEATSNRTDSWPENGGKGENSTGLTALFSGKTISDDSSTNLREVSGKFV